jgi:mannose-6-phosphate isomerase class I
MTTLTIRVDTDSYELAPGETYIINHDTGALTIADTDGDVAVYYPAGAWLTLAVDKK